jgi:ATP-binding cassette, subfamily B, bacterial HlyB/CyaB
MRRPPDHAPAPDPGLLGLSIVARYHGVAVDAADLQRRFGGIGAGALAAAAAHLGLKIREIRPRWRRLAAVPAPALIPCRDGRYLILVRVDGARVLVQIPDAPGLAVFGRDRLEAEWSGRVVLVAPHRATGAAAKRFGLSWFFPFIARYRTALANVLLASLVLQLFALLTPLGTQVVIDKVLVHRGLGTLDVVVVGLLALAVFEAILAGLRTYLFAHTANRIDVELGMQVFHHALRLPLGYFEARRAGDTVARIRELESIRHFLTGPPLTAIVDTLLVGVFLGVMCLYSVALTGIVVGVLPVYAALSLALMPPLRRALDRRAQRGAEAHAFLVETVRGIETVKATAVEPLLERRWDEHLAGIGGAGFRAGQLAQVAGQVSALLGKVVSLAILWVGARAVMRGELTIGELIAFNMFAARVTAPILRLFQLGQDFQQASVAVSRVADLLEAPREAATSSAPPPVARLRGAVVFDEVMFAYRPGAPEVLSRVSFAIPAGHVVGIVGASGSGKSTIAKLMTRLYVPQRGRVLFDGLEGGLCDPAWLRRHVALVPQDTTLFTGSIRENIAWADPGLPMDVVLRAARLAGAHDFIAAMPEGYATAVGEHGALLSGGQRQRIGIARALATNPSVLILDEATSALDYESERLIDRHLPAICSGRTVIIVTHRLTLVRRADHVIALDAGRVIEQGAPAELIARGGYLASLDREQRGLAAEWIPLRAGDRRG